MTGELRKRELGAWMLTAFRLLSRLKGLRGSWADPFARHEDRKSERELIARYEEQMRAILVRVSSANLAIATQLAAIPDQIRGYGPVKRRHLDRAMAREKQLLARFEATL